MTLLKNKSKLLFRRRELRKRQKKQEEVLWQMIRNRKLGIKFRREGNLDKILGRIKEFFPSPL